MDDDFVFVDEVVSGVRWDAKYATWDNFTGKPVDGYLANRIVGTRALCAALDKGAKTGRVSWLRPAPLGRLSPAARRGLVPMGGDHDPMDPVSHHGAETLTEAETRNRRSLRSIMEDCGFNPYSSEWWHYTLKDEPYPDTYFDFPIT
jgi:zinc D-Ala-D-Ala dipeptidase